MGVEEDLLYRIENGVAWLTMNRPQAGNAMTPEVRDRMRDIINGLNESYEARAIVITASGEKMFCPGADISTDRAVVRPDGAPERIVGQNRRMMLNGQLQLMPAIINSELPVIAAVNGTAAGVGAHLALVCDLVIMAENAKFIEVFARRGLIPDGLGTWILPRLIGLQKAKELCFFADDVPAQRALELGLCNKVVPQSDLQQAAREWAERLAGGPTRAYMLMKWLLNRSMDVDMRTIIEEEAWAVELVTQTQDMVEGVASFREKRPPHWTGF
jgi:2-(1,2-epoxy-1,2-dihydrophenyl)acetyl-CoA isomerase